MKFLVADDEPMVLEETKDVIGQVVPQAELLCADHYRKAIQMVEEENVDVAFLDIEMPGMNGLELARILKEKNPDLNIVFVTAYSQYAVEAFSLYASGYLMKPIRAVDVERALENLRNPIKYQEEKLKVQCFGNFEVFFGDVPVAFARSKSKEIFAYLVDRNGASVSTGEICSILWEDSVEIEKNHHYLRNLIADIRKTLKEYGAEGAFLNRRNQFAIVPSMLDCDLYHYLKGDPAAVNSYRGEYMKQYSWAEFSMNQFT